MKSFYLKMAFMNLMIEFSDPNHWAEERLGSVVIQLLEKLKESIEKKNLRHCFIPSLNLFGKLSFESCISDKIGNILKDLQHKPKEFCEKILHAK